MLSCSQCYYPALWNTCLSVCFILSCVTQISTTWVRHQQPTTTVHLAGSFILGHVLLAMGLFAQTLIRCSFVFRPVSMTSTVPLLSGVDVTGTARYITWDLADDCTMTASHSLTSSENVSVRQVRDYVAHFCLSNAVLELVSARLKPNWAWCCGANRAIGLLLWQYEIDVNI